MEKFSYYELMNKIFIKIPIIQRISLFLKHKGEQSEWRDWKGAENEQKDTQSTYKTWGRSELKESFSSLNKGNGFITIMNNELETGNCE